MIVSDRLTALLEPAGEGRAVDLLQRYFSTDGPTHFTGAYFDRFAGGGDRPEVADQFTSDDVVAVSMLSVDVGGEGAVQLLVTRRSEFNGLLAAISRNKHFADLTAEEVGSGWPVRAAERALRTIPGIGPTTASKLLARKRPHLVPIFDSVVDKELWLQNQQLWSPLHAWLTADGGVKHERLVELRARAALDLQISTLRVFDVLAWMIGRDHTRATPEM